MAGFLLFGISATAQPYAAVNLTGFNADVIANGTLPPSASTAFPGGGLSFDNTVPYYDFVAQDYNFSGNTPTGLGYLNTSGVLNSSSRPGLTFQLAGFSSNNALWLMPAASGTLTCTSPQTANTIYVLGSSGGGSSTVDITVTFTDLSTQTFTGVVFADWMSGAGEISGVGRVNSTTGTTQNPTPSPALFRADLALSPGNLSKPVASLSFTRTGGTGNLGIMAVSLNLAPTLSASTASLPSFGSQAACIASSSQNFTIQGDNLSPATGNIVAAAPSGFQVSNDNSTWGSTASFAYASGNVTATVYVRFLPNATGALSGNITFTGGGVGTYPTVSVSGTGTMNSTTGATSVCVGSTTTLTNTSGAGTWSSSGPGIASVGAGTGVVTGVSAGNVSIVYTLACGASVSYNMTVNATPAPITGVAGVCVGSTTNLVESIGGGTWSSGTPANGTVGSATGAVTGIAPGSTLITYAFATGCQVTQTVTVVANPVSASYTVSNNPLCQNTSTTFSSGATLCSVNMLLFNGNNSQASLGAPISTAIDNITMEAWISWSGTTANNQYIMLNGNSTSSGYGLYLPAGSNQLAINLGGVATLTSTATVPIGTWTHVAAVRNAGTWSVYVNGTQFTVTSATSTPNVPATNFRVGCSQAANEAFNGAIDEGKFWSTARATTDIQSDMNACNAFPQTNLLGYWRFDEVSGTSAADWSSNGNTLTESNIAHGGSVNLVQSTYAWSFGDGGTSTVNNVPHTYTTSGNFTSGLTLTNSSGCSLNATTVVTVNPNPVISGTLTVCVGFTTTLSSASPGGTWSSVSPAVGSISSSGVVTGLSAGTTVISYVLSTGCFQTVTVTVNANPTSITGTAAVCVGNTSTLVGAPGGGSWTSSNPAQGTIGAGTGVLGGISAGNPTVTYTFGTGCYLTQLATVNPLPVAITGSAAVCQGFTSTLADASPGGSWSSSAPATGSIGGGTGVLGGVAPGNATITYTLPTGCITTVTATVNSNPNSITGTTNVCTGLTTTLSSTTGGGTWSSSDVARGTISAGGVVTGIAAGHLPFRIRCLPAVMQRLRSQLIRHLPQQVAHHSYAWVKALRSVTQLQAVHGVPATVMRLLWAVQVWYPVLQQVPSIYFIQCQQVVWLQLHSLLMDYRLRLAALRMSAWV